MKRDIRCLWLIALALTACSGGPLREDVIAQAGSDGRIAFDVVKIDDAVLALLMLGASGARAWKGLDALALARLHERGLISDPNDRSATLVFSAEGLARAKRLRDEMFGKRA